MSIELNGRSFQLREVSIQFIDLSIQSKVFSIELTDPLVKFKVVLIQLDECSIQLKVFSIELDERLIQLKAVPIQSTLLIIQLKLLSIKLGGDFSLFKTDSILKMKLIFNSLCYLCLQAIFSLPMAAINPPVFQHD